MNGDKVRIPIETILEHANPIETPPWPDLDLPVDEQMMKQAYLDLVGGRVGPDLFAHPLSEMESRDGRCHAGRVAWLAVNGWEDQISIDATQIDRLYWPVTDGNHRLAAAVLRGDTHIDADIDGFEEDVCMHFGQVVASAVFDDIAEPEIFL